MQEFMRERVAETDRKQKGIEGPTAADVLFGSPDWRNEMATQIARLIEAARDRGGVSSLTEKTAAWKKLRETDPDGLKPETQAAAAAMQIEEIRASTGNAPKIKLGQVFRDLQYLNDPRIVPLIAPALMEKTSPGTSGGDYGISPPQQAAANALINMNDLKIVTIANPKGNHEIDAWRGWWKENKLNFDEVPEPLRAIDEGRIMQTADNKTSFMTPRQTASPEKIAELGAQEAVARKAREAAAAAAPQATPDKPAPAVATSTVTRSGDTSMWFPIAAASAAILLAVGIWFYSRTSRA